MTAPLKSFSWVRIPSPCRCSTGWRARGARRRGWSRFTPSPTGRPGGDRRSNPVRSSSGRWRTACRSDNPKNSRPGSCAWLAARQADVALVMAYGHILSETFIATPRFGTLNLHASILPKYRGASPIQTAVACGERETGVTLMRVVRQTRCGAGGRRRAGAHRAAGHRRD